MARVSAHCVVDNSSFYRDGVRKFLASVTLLPIVDKFTLSCRLRYDTFMQLATLKVRLSYFPCSIHAYQNVVPVHYRQRASSSVRRPHRRHALPPTAFRSYRFLQVRS